MSRRIVRYNPVSEVGTGLWIDGLFAAGGAVVGALTSPPVLPGAIGGAQLGLWIPTIAGAIVGFLSPDGDRRNMGFATAGVGLLGLLGLGVVNRILPSAAPAPTT